MKNNRFLPLLFGMMLMLLYGITQAQEDDIYFDPETDEIVGYNDEYSEDEYVDEEYQYVDENAGMEVRRIRRFRRTFNFVVVYSDPWLYYDDWGWTCRPRFRYRPYRCWRYDRWFHRQHYAHMHYLRNRHFGFHYGNYHWNHWMNHGYHPNYNGHWGYHHPHHHPWGWHYRKGQTNTGRRNGRVGIAASKGPRENQKNVRPSKSTLAMNSTNGKSGKNGRNDKQVISIGKPKNLNNGRNPVTKDPTSTSPSRPSNSGSLAQKPTSGGKISIGTNSRPTKTVSSNPRSDKSGRDKTTNPPRTNKPVQSEKPRSVTRPKSPTRTSSSRSPKTKTTTRSSKPNNTSRSRSSSSRSSSRPKSSSRSSSSRSSSRSSSSRSSSSRKR